MPIKVKDNLPAKEILKSENIFVMDESRAYHQDIRPIKIALLNLMPNKQATEVQLLRLIGNTPLQIEATLVHMESHLSKNTSIEYLAEFYNVFGDIESKKFDGMIITGAPIELLEFKNVSYWDELKKIMEWSKTNVTSTMHICWGAMAALYYHYGIKKYNLESKMFGVFSHAKSKSSDLLRGFDDVFSVPHSRHTEVRKEDFPKDIDLEILSESEEAGVCIAATENGKQIFITGHFEYDPNTLMEEYLRDAAKGDKIAIPKNYFKNDDPQSHPIVTWRCHGNLLFNNWLNYYVYQETPYVLEEKACIK